MTKRRWSLCTHVRYRSAEWHAMTASGWLTWRVLPDQSCFLCRPR
jgi:hypothetical protein